MARCVAAYREQVRCLAEQPLLARVVRAAGRRPAPRQRLRRRHCARRSGGPRSRARDQPATGRCRGSPSSTTAGRRIVEEPPLITRLGRRGGRAGRRGLDDYLETLPPHWRRVLGGYTLVDVAHKVVGVGSVGLRAYVALLRGQHPGRRGVPAAEAGPPVGLAPFVHGDSAWHAHQGQRVVEYQQALQTVSDPLLGWTTVQDRQYYVRQFRNMKGDHRRRRASTPPRWPTTPASAGGCWPRATPGPAAPR